MHSGGLVGGSVSRAKGRSSAQTGRALAQSERAAAGARIARRAQGDNRAPAKLVVAAGVALAVLEVARIHHGDALKVEASRAMLAGRPALTRATKGGC